MQIVGNETRYAYNDRLQNEGGHLIGRFMLPDNPEYGRAWDQAVGARRIRNFALKPGDMCPEDNRTKERVYFVFDVNRPNSDRPANTPLRMSTALDMQVGSVISSWWFTFTQWNQRPGPDGVWRPAAHSLDLEVVNGKEFLTAFIRHLGSDGAVVKELVGAMPFERRRFSIMNEFVCSNGEPNGLGRLTVDGRVIGEYRGPTGFPGGGPVFPAYGMYRATPRSAADAQHVKYENWVEGVAAAV